MIMTMMTFDDFRSLCEERHTVRTFEREPVAKEDILRLLELARLAPSVENLQPWHFHVITNPALRTKLLETSCYGNFVETAGTFVVVTSDKSVEAEAPKTVWNPVELEYSCVAAMEHIILGATAMGLGTNWVSMHHGTAHEALNLPHHEVVVGGILIGHRLREERAQSHDHSRHPLADMVSFHD